MSGIWTELYPKNPAFLGLLMLPVPRQATAVTAPPVISEDRRKPLSFALPSTVDTLKLKSPSSGTEQKRNGSVTLLARTDDPTEGIYGHCQRILGGQRPSLAHYVTGWDPWTERPPDASAARLRGISLTPVNRILCAQEG